ncbi:hypothetical protein AMATHDRAFT_51485 [Amanita thiersii Skay4041]|uniref:Uncharacterized protein n=1 Tax=Amanita thiersii Skay4041 TaxID=703135 RepID=A0A2A9NDQ5_9AGAR|nr:hypothetical protein AMATHDRAFT_51485 [Amanita thiersii Skay4041]
MEGSPCILSFSFGYIIARLTKGVFNMQRPRVSYLPVKNGFAAPTLDLLWGNVSNSVARASQVPGYRNYPGVVLSSRIFFSHSNPFLSEVIAHNLKLCKDSGYVETSDMNHTLEWLLPKIVASSNLYLHDGPVR